jgi:hypothetical protein
MTKKIILGIFILLLAIQVIRIDKTNPPVVASKDFITSTRPSEEVAALLTSACYDCHSNNTQYPWYTNIAPISWWLKNHIHEGREHLNFSAWNDYDAEQKAHKVEEMIEEIKEGEMPLSSYTMMHSEGALSLNQREQLIKFLSSLPHAE